MSMYKDYVENQLDNRFVYESEYGFLTYNIIKDVCQLEEIYIKPEFRRQGKASELYDMADKLARKAGCKLIKGSIIIGTNGAEGSMMCLLQNEYKLFYNDGIIIYLVKDLGE